MITPDQNKSYLKDTDTCPHCGWEENFTLSSITDQEPVEEPKEEKLSAQRMSYTWEVTVEDIHHAINSNKHILSTEFVQSHGLTPDDLMGVAEHAYNAILHRAAEVGMAALYGNDIDDQTVYAHNAIVGILIDEKILVVNNK